MGLKVLELSVGDLLTSFYQKPPTSITSKV
jgi:hypothetical protein